MLRPPADGSEVYFSPEEIAAIVRGLDREPALLDAQMVDPLLSLDEIDADIAELPEPEPIPDETCSADVDTTLDAATADRVCDGAGCPPPSNPSTTPSCSPTGTERPARRRRGR